MKPRHDVLHPPPHPRCLVTPCPVPAPTCLALSLTVVSHQEVMATVDADITETLDLSS
jgi:hypothetical protein